MVRHLQRNRLYLKWALSDSFEQAHCHHELTGTIHLILRATEAGNMKRPLQQRSNFCPKSMAATDSEQYQEELFLMEIFPHSNTS